MEDDRAYFERRLKEELTRASGMADEGLRALHRRWAALYRERLARLPRRRPVDLPKDSRAPSPTPGRACRIVERL